MCCRPLVAEEISVESTPHAQSIAREMLDCLADVYKRDRPTQDPDAAIEEP